MKTKYLFLAALTSIALVSCMSDEFVGDNTSPKTLAENDGAIMFNYNLPNLTRAGELTGATAAEKLGGMFVVEGTKGTEAADAPSTTVVFDNYLVGYEYNSAGRTESNTNNWEYVGKQTGITNRMTAATWTALHTGAGTAQSQTIKYWDYSVPQYDFIAWSTGTCEAVTDAAASTKVKVTRINTGTDLSSTVTGKGGFTMSVANATDLEQCYYTDINTVEKANYGDPVTLKFRNLAAKVRVALYETVPGYSVKDVKFYSAESDKDGTPAYDPEDLGTGSSATNAVLFTTGDDRLPLSGDILVYYPRIGTGSNSAADYNKASVTVTAGSTKATSQTFGALTNQYVGREQSEKTNDNIYLGRTLPLATFAGKASDNYYTAVFPNTVGKPLTLRVDYTLVPIDGADEEIKVYGAKAVVPATYTNWLPNYAYTYIFKISDNSNGWTSQTATDPQGLFPITFDAIVASFIDVNAEQTTVTTVATPSITTYQQGHTKANSEYYNQQKAGADGTNVKDLYVQVMDNSTATPTLKTDLQGTGPEAGKKSLLFSVSKAGASEAEVMDALQNRTNAFDAESPVGRNGITLTTNGNIANNVTEIVNGVDDQPIGINAGEAAKIDIDQLGAGTYAYVYCTTVPTADEVIYNVVSATTAAGSPASYFEIAPSSIGTTPLSAGSKAEAGKVYFVKTTDAVGGSVTYTFKQTKVDDDVAGLYEATIGAKASDYTAGNFYFEVYNQNNGAYAVKVIKVTATAP